MKSATLILSFDCEGKWGIADRPAHRLSAITQDSLRQAYKTILALHKKHRIQSTFAFVAALCMRKVELEAWLNETRTLEFRSKNWLAPALAQLAAGVSEGWCDETLFRMVKDAGNHELCSHGGTHLPYSEQDTSVEAVLKDLSLTRQVFAHLHTPLKNLIFPRNIIGFRHLLADAGYRGYRDMDAWEMRRGKYGKLSRLTAELVPIDKYSLPNRHFSKDSFNLTKIPAAKFLNASFGARSFISTRITNYRTKTLLQYAISNNRVVHFYSHPHNFITDHSLPDKLEFLLKHASQYRDQGSLEIITMEQWRTANE